MPSRERHDVPSWKVRYLANILAVMRADGGESPREMLLIDLFRTRLHLSAQDVAEAVLLALEPAFVPRASDSPLTDAHNAEDMLVAALVDDLLSDSERQAIDGFASGVGLDPSASPR